MGRNLAKKIGAADAAKVQRALALIDEARDLVEQADAELAAVPRYAAHRERVTLLARQCAAAWRRVDDSELTYEELARRRD